jgi:hypothetical protein
MKRHGSCLCGAITYEVDGPMREVVACHCIQCRKQTGHHIAMTNAKVADFRLLTSAPLKWYRASDAAKRGFCGDCGSVMFWQGDGRDEISISAGSIDGQTGLTLDGHIFCDYAGDYYEITGGGYQRPEA